jgi:hypothetical protein
MPIDPDNFYINAPMKPFPIVETGLRGVFWSIVLPGIVGFGIPIVIIPFLKELSERLNLLEKELLKRGSGFS